ncbi:MULTISPECIES: serine O-acetyltransferase [Leeia]|uniref:Serine acetyltransferase n=1 Tax=Leeia aquatica TaxID=2725557 RepID=A0A847SC88_9NEIS|nr:serine O-acetyltransferase [Leeia aquatica]NLR76487.1 serine O-acetyltransferase [Leeia aquatica]
MSKDALWLSIRDEVSRTAAEEPMLASFLHMTVLRHKTLDDVVAFHLSSKLASPTMDARVLMELISEALAADPVIMQSIRADIEAVRSRDPACKDFSTPLLFFKGFQALQCYRIGNWLWRQGRHALAMHIQNRISEVFAVEIHPAARIGKGILLDHGTGFVVGETAVIEDDVSILQEVTLGGTGKESGDRHPKIRQGVLIGAGAKILGNIEVGKGAKVGAGSVVLKAVPPHVTVAGVPARVVGVCENDSPAEQMDHRIQEPLA